MTERNLPIIGRIYRHYKGDYYIVRAIARHSETGEQMVLYQALYGDGELWARPLTLFMDKVDRAKHPDVKQKNRFELQEIESHAHS
jgi:hypothetical protein